MKPTADKYIALAKVLKEENLDNSIIAAIIQEVAKDLRMSIIREEKELNKHDWRDEPATDKQKTLLNKYKVAYEPNISKGKASDLIEYHKSPVTEEKVK